MNWYGYFLKWSESSFVDILVRHVAPWLSCTAVISGGLLTYDFTHLRAIYPNWLGLFNLLSDGFIFWTFIIAATLVAIISWISAARQKSIDSLKAERAIAQEAVQQIGNNIRFVFDGLLLNLSRKLNFPQNDQTRLSLYIHYAEHDYFVPCGRYSPNPKFRKPGRTSYPDNQGCIARGWQNGWHFDASFPEDMKDYRSYCLREYGVPNTIHNRIRMRSRVYAVKRLDDPMGNQLGVLVIEALEHDRFDEQGLLDNLNGVVDDFAQLIRTLRTYIPNPNDAAAKGL